MEYFGLFVIFSLNVIDRSLVMERTGFVEVLHFEEGIIYGDL